MKTKYEVGEWITLDYPQQHMNEEGGVTGVQGKHYQIARVEEAFPGSFQYYLHGVVYVEDWGFHQAGEMCSWSVAWFKEVDPFIQAMLTANHDE